MSSCFIFVQIAGLRKHVTRLRGQTGSRKEDIVSTLGRLSQFHDSLQTATDKIDELVETVAHKLSQPIADDVHAIQRDQKLFQVSLTYFAS